ncbi:MAG: FAD-dependent oxidoreductase [Alphaproteobacteria bacterium]
MRLGRHIAVIGAGVVGLAIAVRLRREGFRITLIDPNEPGSQTSSGNASLIMTGKATPHSEPGLWHKLPSMMRDQNRPFVIRPRAWPRLMPWFTRFMKNTSPKRYQELSEALAPLVMPALDAWANLLSPSDTARYLRKEGILYVYRKRKNLAWGKKEAAIRERLGVSSMFISGAEIPDVEPELDPTLLGGIYYPESGHTTDHRRCALRCLSPTEPAAAKCGAQALERCVRGKTDLCAS